MKIKLEIYRKRGGRRVGSPIFKEYNIDERKEQDAKNKAELIFLNEYINRNIPIEKQVEFTELNLVKSMVDLSIKAYRV